LFFWIAVRISFNFGIGQGNPHYFGPGQINGLFNVKLVSWLLPMKFNIENSKEHKWTNFHKLEVLL
jgi:hypothetical protein